MNLEGKLLGNRYEIIEKVGNGGMATVYKATDKVLKRYVAVKILRDEFTTDEEFIKRFEVEAQSAARLAHPNIVSIYDVGVDGNLYYIVMELIQGKTLKEIILEEKGPLPWKWSVNVAIQIASALEMAHKNNIIHRDIKPHNIIITEDGVAKVTDFGIAKAVSNSTITAFGTTIGSVHYFSPEHARGGFTDAKSDLYSLGVVMYEMVTGRVPFDADTPVSVALKHMQEQPEEPIEVNPNVPIAINKIIMRALQKDTTLRYQTATEMLIDLRKALKNPNGDFVDDKEYDPTAATQIINTEMYNNVKNRDNEDQAENGKKENKLKRFIKNHKKLSIFIGLILLFSLSLGGTILALNITNPPEVNIPNVVGMAKDEAQREVENEKLKFSIEKEEYNKDVPEGFVISQKVDGDTIGDFTTTPSTDRKVKEGTTIKVIVSKGQEKTTVPKVIGMKQDEAIKALEAANLKAEVIEETSKKVEEGYVISQETDANAEAYAGDTVKIHVSTGTGIKQVTVVSVIGQDEATAKKTLTDLGLKVNITYADSTSDNGKVAKQSLDAGKVVDEGTTITLTVNKVAESKNVTVNINVKAITGGYTESANETETTSKKVNIKVNNETRTGIDKNKSDFSITLSGKDGESGQITVVITDPTSGATLYSSSKTITYGSQDAVSFN
ncbi:MAG: Stk1 family PASTA domain-containing Ser/Thr kinase [Clostridiales bacterium]|nr:Stk1 family PASTA domain-containing Ser/Thr kinase [Clostridiales bacterium]MBD9159413.1 Stk1 family PASTA domain-containing Ser/Thr kinase [Clostridiales bacterium]